MTPDQECGQAQSEQSGSCSHDAYSGCCICERVKGHTGKCRCSSCGRYYKGVPNGPPPEVSHGDLAHSRWYASDVAKTDADYLDDLLAYLVRADGGHPSAQQQALQTVITIAAKREEGPPPRMEYQASREGSRKPR